MLKVKGTLVAARPRKIKTRNAEVDSYQVAYIPAGDPHDFPSVLNVTVEVYGQIVERGGEECELMYIETPPYGDKLAVSVVFASAVKVA